MPERDRRREAGVAALALTTAGLAVVTVMGMVSGSHRQFDRGVAPRDLVALQLGLGTAFLLSAGIVAWRLVALWQGKAGAGWPVARWFAVAVILWVAWLFVLVLEYAS